VRLLFAAAFVAASSVGCALFRCAKQDPTRIGDGCAEWSCDYDDLGATNCECVDQ
jgi:hypothetical protein